MYGFYRSIRVWGKPKSRGEFFNRSTSISITAAGIALEPSKMPLPVILAALRIDDLAIFCQAGFAWRFDPRTVNHWSTIVYAYAFGVLIASICAAQILEKRSKARMPQTLPYRWGYYVGCTLLTSALLALRFAYAAVFFAANNKAQLFGRYFLTAYFGFLSVCGWFIIKRRWWAWVLGTIFSLNMLFWITNSVYGSNRRKELSKKSHRTH